MQQKQILIIDDEKDIRDLLGVSLRRLEYPFLAAEDFQSARSLIESDQPIDFCLTDIRLPDGSGLDLIKLFKQHRPEANVAVMTAYDSTDIAVEAMKAGAYDFLAKPIRLERLRTMLENALGNNSGPSDARPNLSEQLLIGQSQPIQQLREYIDKVSRTLAPVLIQGESGTGKELVARSIHGLSGRSAAPFIPVNCGAIPSELMESEFFGHKKGAFTGAGSDKEGLFQAAEGGTLFLDEIADLPLQMQVKLLRAIQEKCIRPVGGHSETPTNVRILSASHRDLQQAVGEGKFRQDLYYRLNVITLQVPALRDRREDLPDLCAHLLRRNWGGDNPTVKILPDAMEKLSRYNFPGNVRELENILMRAAALCDGEKINASDLDLNVSATSAEQTPNHLEINDLEAHMAGIEQKILEQVLQHHQGKRKAVARHLGLTDRQLRYKLIKYQLND